jgi:hypothetical protein
MTPNKSHGLLEPVELTLSKELDFEPFYVAEPRLFFVTDAISSVTPM